MKTLIEIIKDWYYWNIKGVLFVSKEKKLELLQEKFVTYRNIDNNILF